MKRLVIAAIMAAVAVQVIAEGKTEDKKHDSVLRGEKRSDLAVWPAFFAVCEYPASADVVGLRLTIPFSTMQDNVTGFDIGLWGRSTYFEGVQAYILRNDVKDAGCGIQFGIYNSIGSDAMNGIQLGLWNEAGCILGLQGGIVNVAGDIEGFQVGLINRCEAMHGFQVGVINVIRSAEMKFCPIVNIGF